MRNIEADRVRRKQMKKKHRALRRSIEGNRVHNFDKCDIGHAEIMQALLSRIGPEENDSMDRYWGKWRSLVQDKRFWNIDPNCAGNPA